MLPDSWKVTVTFKGQSKTATAGQDGTWMVKLEPLEAEKQPQELTVADGTAQR